MFDIIVEKYKSLGKNEKLPRVIIIQMVVLMVFYIMTVFFLFLNKLIIATICLVILVADVLWLFFYTKRNKGKYNNIDEMRLDCFNKRISDFRNILEEENIGLFNNKGIEWLVDVGNRYLAKEPERRIIMPFTVAVIVPIILNFFFQFVEMSSLDVCSACLLIVITALLYFALVWLESEIKDILNARYRLVERMIEDLLYIKMRGFDN